MGIVVCLALLIGVVSFLPKPWLAEASITSDRVSIKSRTAMVAPPCLAIFGVWNFFWYGLRHAGDFWGYAALLTGALMLLAAIELKTARSIGSSRRLYGCYRFLLFTGLLSGFLLYVITLIQLNLGLPTLG